jgi:RNA polymerase sigma factor (sigma-70 family)
MSDGINDGFGDALSTDEMTAYLASNERLLRIKAADRTRGNVTSNDTWQDLLQEGRIVQWRVLTRRPDAPREYVSAAMSHRLVECVMRGTWTGMPTAQGRPRDPLRRGDRDSVDDETLQLDQVLQAAEVLDDVCVAYHHGEILQALNALTLTQREIAVLRYYGGWSDAEIAVRQGCSKQTVERRWREQVRPALAARLGLLAGM